MKFLRLLSIACLCTVLVCCIAELKLAHAQGELESFEASELSADEIAPAEAAPDTSAALDPILVKYLKANCDGVIDDTCLNCWGECESLYPGGGIGAVIDRTRCMRECRARDADSDEIAVP